MREGEYSLEVESEHFREGGIGIILNFGAPVCSGIVDEDIEI